MSISYPAAGFAALVLMAWLFRSWLRMRRAEFIRTYKWPPGLLEKLAEHYPDLARKDTALVSRGLRQFFIAHLMSGKRFVSMPSRVADDLWHEFILYTREYKRFCRQAFGFGAFLHHTPAIVLSVNRRGNEGLRRVWWYSCKYENIDPHHPSRLPLLFALDAKLNIPNGFRYHPQCEALRAGTVAVATGATGAAVYCGGDFSSSSFDGGTAGFGDGAGNGDGGGGDGGGDGGGGCGGGGGD